MKIVGGLQQSEQPIEYLLATNAEVYAVGEILTLSSGAATKAGVDTDGTQLFICLAALTGETGKKNVPAVRIRKDLQFEAMSSGQIAATAVNTAYTLDTAATGITATTTKGCFVVDKTDGATTSKVVGHFINGL